MAPETPPRRCEAVPTTGTSSPDSEASGVMTASCVRPHPDRSRPVRSRLALALLSALAVLAATVTTVSAAAEQANPIELPDAGSVDLSVGLATTTLCGGDAMVTLDATNTTEAPLS